MIGSDKFLDSVHVLMYVQQSQVSTSLRETHRISHSQKSSVLKLDADKTGYLAPTQIQVETFNMLLKQIHILFVSHTHTRDNEIT
jgi:hypothetical protein